MNKLVIPESNDENIKENILKYLDYKMSINHDPMANIDEIYTKLECSDLPMYVAIAELLSDGEINQVRIGNKHSSWFITPADWPIALSIHGTISISDEVT